MEKISEIVENLLKEKVEYISEDGKILKTKVYEDIVKMKEELIELLMSNESLKKIFFVKVKDVYVFDKQKFISFLEAKEFLPDSYTTFKNKIGLTDKKGNYLSNLNDVVISFPYKDCVLEGGQTKEDQKRDEIVYNEVLGYDEISRMLAPKIFTNAKRYTKDGIEEDIEFTDNDNLIIKGNNLVALSSLLERYEGKIKCIYIDPPYNTGSDSFGYNDKFNHSTWLLFMKNRLELAKKLLRDDGIIFVQCDDKEIYYLGVLLKEIFDDNFINLITVKTKIGGVSGSSEGKSLKDVTEFISCFAKNKDSCFLNPVFEYTSVIDYINEYKETGKSWKYTQVLVELGDKVKVKENEKETYYYYPNAKMTSVKNYAKELNISENQVYSLYPDKIFRTTNAQSSVRQTVIENLKDFNDGIVSIEYTPIKGKNANKLTEVFYNGYNKDMVMFLSEMLEEIDGKLMYKNKLNSLWTKIQYNNLTKEGSVAFPSGKKPEKLLANILDIATKEGDIVLDFFSGSGSFGTTSLKKNRKFILIEQMEYIQSITLERLKNVINGEQGGISKEIGWQGGGSFVYCELKEDSLSLISKIQASTEETILEIKEEIFNDDRIVPYITKKELKMVNDEFEQLSFEDKKDILIRLVDKNKLYVNYSEINDERYNISEAEKKFTNSFYKEVE